MSAPDLCDGCLADRAWCVCGVAIPAPGERPRGAHWTWSRAGVLRIGPLDAFEPLDLGPLWRAVQAPDPDAGHDPGDEHRDARAEWTRATIARWSRTLEILGRGPDEETP